MTSTLAVPFGVYKMYTPEDVYVIPPIAEQCSETLTYTILYQVHSIDEESIWCQEIFAGQVFAMLRETIQSRIILSAPTPLILIMINAVLVDVDAMSHAEHVENWDLDVDEEEGSDPDDPYIFG